MYYYKPNSNKHPKNKYDKKMYRPYPDQDMDMDMDMDYEEPSLKYIPTPVIKEYIGQVINTYIPGYGKVNVYVKGIDRHGMVELVLIKPRPQDYIYVHQSDMVGIYPPTI